MLGSWVRAPGGSPDESFAKGRWNSCCFCRRKQRSNRTQNPCRWEQTPFVRDSSPRRINRREFRQTPVELLLFLLGCQTSRPYVFRLSTTLSGARSDRHATVESTLFSTRCAAFAADGGGYDLVLYGIFGIFVECRIDLCLLIHLVESDFRQRIENLFVFCHIISKICCTFVGETFVVYLPYTCCPALIATRYKWK